MECERCKKAGKEPKLYRYSKAGHWERLYHCRHQTHEGLTTKGKPRQKRPPLTAKMKYTPEMDQFLLRNYDGKRRGSIKELVKAFAERFGIDGMRTNQVIGRWTRLQLRETQKALQNQVRGTPSLPALKFMQGEC